MKRSAYAQSHTSANEYEWKSARVRLVPYTSLWNLHNGSMKKPSTSSRSTAMIFFIADTALRCVRVEVSEMLENQIDRAFSVEMAEMGGSELR